MKYVSVDDLVSFALSDESLWLYPKEPMDLRPFIEHAIKFGGVRAIEEEDDTGTLKKLEKRITTLEAEMRMWKHIQSSFYGKGSKNESSYDRKESDGYVSFETREAAENTLNELKKLILKKGYATVEDYYILTNQPLDPECHRYGWKKMDDVSVYSYCDYRGKGKRIYGLRLPDPMPIEIY